MALFLLKPACKDYLWGGTRLREDWQMKSEASPLAEAWVLSCHRDGPSRLPDGQTLPEYIKTHPDCLGSACKAFADFPMLIKLIDAKDDLSIQVHPSDEYALAHEGQYGKTEMWYILDHEPGAFLYYGFSRPVSREEFARRIEDKTLPEVLNAVPVHRGDCFFIPAGTLHAIGRGILLAEVQQNSNVTYRVYDYDRRGPDGKPRQLHIEQALAVTGRETSAPARRTDGHLAKCHYFTTDVREGDFSLMCDGRSFLSLVILEGNARITNGDQCLETVRGDSLFVPAASGLVRVDGSCRVLCTYLEP